MRRLASRGANPFDVRDLLEIFEKLRQRDLLELALRVQAIAFVAFVAEVAARLDVAGRFAQKRNGEALAHRFVVDPERRRVQDFDTVRGIVGVEDRDGQVVAIDDLDRPDDERIFRREELMTAFVPRGNFVENPMMHEAAQDLAQCRDRGQRFGAVSARVDDLQALAARPCGSRFRRLGREALYERREEPFAIAG
ncbi:MAG: hypothetical protein IAI50_09575 [Candidatus Eremiobacteraeota bacterium]|nr:hypothetical protein [Candidatus Eremiobacteraeota bacterium]